MLTTIAGEAFTTAVQHFPDSGPAADTGARIWIHILNPEAPLVSAAAMIDTGATWSVFGPALWERLELPIEAPLLQVRMDTRLGKYDMELHRVRIGIRTDVGAPQVEIEATIGLAMQWNGPDVIGYQGFLDRLRFAVDPLARAFHFGPVA